MSNRSEVVVPANPPGFFRRADGTKSRPPKDWALLLPGDAGLTRRVKAAGPSWTVQAHRRPGASSQGVWAPARIIAQERARLAEERQTLAHQKRLADGAKRRERQQEAYVEDFHGAVLACLKFHPRFADDAWTLAAAVTAQATPVGSGTVARTARIPIEERAHAALMAWMRHHTTHYDTVHRDAGPDKRREVRRKLAKKSRALLESYRAGKLPPANCPLQAAIKRLEPAPKPAPAAT